MGKMGKMGKMGRCANVQDLTAKPGGLCGKTKIYCSLITWKAKLFCALN